MESWDDHKIRVLEKIKPTDIERRRLNSSISELTASVGQFLKDYGIESAVESHGSVAHDTWLSGESDIDLFIILNLRQGRSGLSRVVDALKTYFKDNWVEAYTEHPYLQTNFNGFKVDLVPCFRVEGGRIASATDRTPLHTKYLKKALTSPLHPKKSLAKSRYFLFGMNPCCANIHTGYNGYIQTIRRTTWIRNIASFPSTAGAFAD